MTHFKFILFIISILIIGITSCIKDDITGSLYGKYTGEVLTVRGHTYDSYSGIDSTTREISIEITYSKFRKTGEGGFQDCIGSIEIEGDEIEFMDGNCGCYCDCLPYIECNGDVILRKYNFELNNDSLIMVNKINRDVELINGIYLMYTYEEHYTLTRN